MASYLLNQICLSNSNNPVKPVLIMLSLLGWFTVCKPATLKSYIDLRDERHQVKQWEDFHQQVNLEILKSARFSQVWNSAAADFNIVCVSLLLLLLQFYMPKKYAQMRQQRRVIVPSMLSMVHPMRLVNFHPLRMCKTEFHYNFNRKNNSSGIIFDLDSSAGGILNWGICNISIQFNC